MVDFELIIKYFSGKASPKEAEQVEDFAQSSPEKQAYFQSLHQSWIASGEETFNKPDIQKEWEHFNQTFLKTPTKHNLLKPFAIAASVIILLGLAGYLVFFNNSQKTIIVSNQKQQVILLEDSTNVVLAPHAYFQYPKPFDKNSREVSLKGNAHFEVHHNSLRPFIIHLNYGLNIRVTGTSFSVTESTNKITVNLQKGRVLFYNKSDTLPLVAGESGQYLLDKNEFLLLPPKVKTGTFQFRDEPLSAVATKLNLYFGVQIHFKNPDIAHCRFSAGMNDKNIHQIINIIALTFNLDDTFEGKNIILDGEGCP